MMKVMAKARHHLLELSPPQTLLIYYNYPRQIMSKSLMILQERSTRCITLLRFLSDNVYKMRNQNALQHEQPHCFVPKSTSCLGSMSYNVFFFF